MARCSRCGRVWRELDDEQGDHPCDCPVTHPGGSYEDWDPCGEDDDEDPPTYGTSPCGHSERFVDWEDHSQPIVCTLCEIARLTERLVADETDNHRLVKTVAFQSKEWKKDIAKLATAEARYEQLKAINDDNTKSFLDEMCKHTETLAKLSQAEALLREAVEAAVSPARDWLNKAKEMCGE